MCISFSMYISSLYNFIFTHPHKARLCDLSIRPPTSITLSLHTEPEDGLYIGRNM